MLNGYACIGERPSLHGLGAEQKHEREWTFDADRPAGATPDEIEAIVAQSQKRSAVCDIVTNPTNVAVEVNQTRA
jgi:hypothetical protein